MEKKIGLIGSGNMAQAMIGGIRKGNLIAEKDIIVSDVSEQQLKKVREKFNIVTTTENEEVASLVDILILAVKPHLYASVIRTIKDVVRENTIIVTIAAGITMEFMEKEFNRKIKLVRTMPNTAAMVGEAMTAICYNENVASDELDMVVKIFESFGETEIIEEGLMDAVTSVSGSSPAYVYMFIEALADGAVLGGIPRNKAYRMAAQAVLGAAKMVLETGEHPGALKDNVCSPGGTTIEAVFTLEKNNFRGTIMEAMEQCTEKAIRMSEQNKD